MSTSLNLGHLKCHLLPESLSLFLAKADFPFWDLGNLIFLRTLIKHCFTMLSVISIPSQPGYNRQARGKESFLITFSIPYSNNNR